MKRGSGSSLYYYYGLGKKGGRDDSDESSKETIRVSAKAHKLAQRENVRSYCIFCDGTVNTMMVREEEGIMREVMEEKNMAKVIGEVGEEKGEEVEQINGVKEEKRMAMEEKMAKIVGGVEEEKGDRGGKEEVMVDHGNQDMDVGEGASGETNGGGANGVYGVVVGNVLKENNNNVDMLASDIFAECDLSSLGDWKFEWACYYPFYWESEYGAYYYWDVLGNEAVANQ